MKTHEEKVLEASHFVNSVYIEVMKKIVNIEPEQRYLILGRIINLLVDTAYKPMLVEYLKYKENENENN